jgi:hypothetical protein
MPARVGETVPPAVPVTQGTSVCLAPSAPGPAQVRRARRLVERWAGRIRTLARDEAEPAWANKAAVLGSRIAEVARAMTDGGPGSDAG